MGLLEVVRTDSQAVAALLERVAGQGGLADDRRIVAD